MEQQTYPPKRPNLAHFVTPEEEKACAEGRAQFDQLLDDYRKRYVLRHQQNEKPAP